MAAHGLAGGRSLKLEKGSGFGRLSSVFGLEALNTAVRPCGSPLLGVAPIEWNKMLSGGAVPAFLSNMVPAAVGKRPSPPCQLAVQSVTISLDTVLELVSKTAGETVDADAPLMQAGVDSLGAVELRNQLQHAVGSKTTVSSTLMFDHPTAREVFLALNPDDSEPEVYEEVRCSGNALGATNVYIAGSDGALPGPAQGYKAIWGTLGQNVDLVIPVHASRMTLGPDEGLELGLYFGAELFDAKFFHHSLAEVNVMDPQHRLLLERSYSSFHCAGLRRPNFTKVVCEI